MISSLLSLTFYLDLFDKMEMEKLYLLKKTKSCFGSIYQSLKCFENEKIAEVAETWINQKRFPILFVTVKSWSHDDLKGNLLTSSLADETPEFIIV